MADIIQFVPKGHKVITVLPETQMDYQEIVKEQLDKGDYEQFLLGVMDKEYYEGLDKELKVIVDRYFTFKP